MFQDIHNNVFIDPSNLALFPGLSPRLLSLAFHNASDKNLGDKPGNEATSNLRISFLHRGIGYSCDVTEPRPTLHCSYSQVLDTHAKSYLV